MNVTPVPYLLKINAHPRDLSDAERHTVPLQTVPSFKGKGISFPLKPLSGGP